MSETGELWQGIRECRMHEGIVRREAATDDFRAALRRCNAAGFIIKRHSETHYSITHPLRGWRINVYPGNRRISMDRNHPKAPFLKLPDCWSLEDVVSAAIAAIQEPASDFEVFS